MDALAVILSLANVGAYRRVCCSFIWVSVRFVQVLVVDNCMGMVVSAVEERLGGFGDICVGYFGKKCKLEVLKRFSNKRMPNLHKLPLVDLIQLKNQQTQTSLNDEDLQLQELAKRHSVSPDKLHQWLERGFDSCILADWKICPLTLIEGVLPLLAPSASFVVYSPGLTPLVACQHHLMQRKDVVMVELQDLWWREYQVCLSTPVV